MHVVAAQLSFHIVSKLRLLYFEKKEKKRRKGTNYNCKISVCHFVNAIIDMKNLTEPETVYSALERISRCRQIPIYCNVRYACLSGLIGRKSGALFKTALFYLISHEVYIHQGFVCLTNSAPGIFRNFSLCGTLWTL